jgi:hypothetical protein
MRRRALLNAFQIPHRVELFRNWAGSNEGPRGFKKPLKRFVFGRVNLDGGALAIDGLYQIPICHGPPSAGHPGDRRAERHELGGPLLRAMTVFGFVLVVGGARC